MRVLFYCVDLGVFSKIAQSFCMFVFFLPVDLAFCMVQYTACFPRSVIGMDPRAGVPT